MLANWIQSAFSTIQNAQILWFDFLGVRVSLYILPSFKLDILLPQPSECLDYRYLSPLLSVPAFLKGIRNE